MGTGEVTRHLATYGSGRIRGAGLFAPLQPFLLKTTDNPEGVDPSVFEGLKQAIVADRPAYLKNFLENFYNHDVYGGTRVSEQAFQASWNVAVAASAKATLDCIDSWLIDFRDDLPKIGVPVLIVQGSEDRVLPIEATGNRLRALIKDVRFVVIEGGPHGIGWTHADELNRAVLDFVP